MSMKDWALANSDEQNGEICEPRHVSVYKWNSQLQFWDHICVNETSSVRRLKINMSDYILKHRNLMDQDNFQA